MTLEFDYSENSGSYGQAALTEEHAGHVVSHHNPILHLSKDITPAKHTQTEDHNPIIKYCLFMTKLYGYDTMKMV